MYSKLSNNEYVGSLDSQTKYPQGQHSPNSTDLWGFVAFHLNPQPDISRDANSCRLVDEHCTEAIHGGTRSSGCV